MIHLLAEKGAKVSYHDPHVPSFQHEGMEMVGVTDLDLALCLADCVVVVTDHAAYDWPFIFTQNSRIIDTRHPHKTVVFKVPSPTIKCISGNYCRSQD